MSSDRECNSEGERLHNTRQRAAELRVRSDNEQSEEVYHGEDSCTQDGARGSEDETGRASLAAALAADEDTENYAEGIGGLYATNEEERGRSTSRDERMERASTSQTHRHQLPADQMAEDSGEQPIERYQPDRSPRLHTRPEDRIERQDSRGAGGRTATSADATSRPTERDARETPQLIDQEVERPSALQQTVARLTESVPARGQGRKGRPSRRSRGARRLSPLLITHEGQEFRVAQPFKSRDNYRGSTQPREGEPVPCGSWSKRDGSPNSGMGETLFRTQEKEDTPGLHRVTKVLRQTKQEAYDRQQYGLHMAHQLALSGIHKRHEPQASREKESPRDRSHSKSHSGAPSGRGHQLDTRSPFGSHMAQQHALAAARKGDESTADDETDDDVWYETGEHQLHGVPIDWDEKRQEPIGEFDLAYCSIQRGNYEHRTLEEETAREERMRREIDNRRSGGGSRPKDHGRGTREISKEANSDRSVGLAQGSVVHSPEEFIVGLRKAIRTAQLPEGKESDKNSVRLRQVLTRLSDRVDELQDEKDRGLVRSRHPAGNTFKEERVLPGATGAQRQLSRDQGEGDASQKRPVASLSNADVAWLKKAAAGSSLGRLQQRCAERKSMEDAELPEPDTYFKHERAPSHSSPVKTDDTTLTAELIGYIEGQEKRMEKLEEQVRASRQSSPQRRDAEDPLAGARRFLQERVAAGREEERYTSELEQEATNRPRRSVRIKEQMVPEQDYDNSYGKQVEQEIKRRQKKKPQSLETRAARRKREFLAKMAAFETESTGDDTEGELSTPAPVIQMRTSGPVTKVKPPSFDGTMFLAFEQQFEAACRCSGYDEAARVELLRCSLRGPARQLLLNTGADSWTYAQLMEALRTRHGKTRSKTEIRNALREMYKKPGQKALDFADEIDWVASQAEFTPKELTTATYEAFWHGLRTTPRQQKYVEKHDTTQTMKMAAEIAARWERTKGTTEDAYVPQPVPPVDWAIIQARQTINTGAPMTGVHRPITTGPGQVIASAMSNEALLRQEERDREDKRRGQEERDREDKRRGQGASAVDAEKTWTTLLATLDDLSRDHAILKNSVYQERSQRANYNNRRGGGYRTGPGRGGYNGQRRGPPQQNNSQDPQQDGRAPLDQQGAPRQA